MLPPGQFVCYLWYYQRGRNLPSSACCDQQIPLERAFSSPYDLKQRLGHDLDARELAGYDLEALTAIFAQRPAL